MAIKKSELYSSLWASCDELRGGMDASQYKGASFKDMVALKGKSDIGDKINKRSSGRWPMPTSCPTCLTSMMRPSWATARRRSTG